ncbi:MAG: hypothetical protein H8E49_10670 [Gammaproteobacteria bacterium]|nr:hypothetical protein [Gammaproteobacteria bacterium]
MSSNQILTILSVLIALGATAVPDVMPYWALVLVAVGLVSGFMNPLPDMTSRMAYTVAAVAIPTIANALDAIPVVGAHANMLIDNIMISVAGMVIANFILLMISQMRSSD